MKIVSAEEYKAKQQECEDAIARVDLLLENGRYEDACLLLDEQQICNLSLVNRKLHVMEIMKNIQRQESVSKVRGVFEGRSVAAICELYQTLVCLLRRIEFRFPEQYQREILQYLDREEISLVCVIGITYGNPYILDKKGTMDRFYQLIQDE